MKTVIASILVCILLLVTVITVPAAGILTVAEFDARVDDIAIIFDEDVTALEQSNIKQYIKICEK